MGSHKTLKRRAERARWKARVAQLDGHPSWRLSAPWRQADTYCRERVTTFGCRAWSGEPQGTRTIMYTWGCFPQRGTPSGAATRGGFQACAQLGTPQPGARAQLGVAGGGVAALSEADTARGSTPTEFCMLMAHNRCAEAAAEAAAAAWDDVNWRRLWEMYLADWERRLLPVQNMLAELGWRGWPNSLVQASFCRVHRILV